MTYPFFRTIYLIGLLLVSAADAAGMSMHVYEELQAIEELISANEYEQAKEQLGRMLADPPQRKEDGAYLYYTAGMFYLNQSDFKQAKSHLLSAYKLDGLPLKTTLYLLKILAGLNLQEEEFQKAVDYYQRYLNLAPEPDKNVYLGLATAYFQQQKYESAVTILTRAVKQFAPMEHCYAMLFSSYYELKQLKKAVAVLEKMIRLWPDKKTYWLQLASLYIEVKQYLKSLEIMQIALNRNHLIREKDLFQYVYTLYEENLPYKAAVTLQNGMQKNIVAKNRKNYEYLSSMYQEARERSQAISALKNAAVRSDDGKNDLYIAQLYFEMETDFVQVVTYARKAIEKGVLQEGNANMLIAAAYSELGEMENARAYLVNASKYKETRKASKEWLKALPLK